MEKIDCSWRRAPRHARFAIGLSIALAIAGCATRPEKLETTTRPLVLERDFAGQNYAVGSFRNSITGFRRDFKVSLTGVSRAGVFILSEKFHYADGQRDQKTWRFERLADGRYRGVREDVVGFADVFKDGNALRLSYDVDLPGEGGSTRVHFEDILARRADGAIVNNAVVSKFGLPVGAVELGFSRKPL